MLQITLKDLKLLARDRRAAVVLLALPLIFITIIGLSTGQILSAREGGERVRVAVVSEVAPSTQAGEPESAADDGESTEADETESEPAPRGPSPQQLVSEALATIRSHDHFELTEVENHERALEELDRG